MSKIYRCIDCGKEFKFDFTDIKFDAENEDSEEFQNQVNEYLKAINFPLEINICYECLKNIKTDNSFKNQNKNNNINNSFNQYVNDLNAKFNNDEKIIKNITEEDVQKEEKELKALKEKVDKNQSDLNIMLKELENIEKKETEFCDEFRDLENKLYFAEKDLCKSNDLKLDYENKINLLRKNNAFSELFQISFNDKFGSINGCKFCDPNNSNNYDSINGGWGYIVLLTKILAVKYKFESSKYELIPEGNFSKIINKEINEEYEIGISDMNRTKDKFNRAMEAYLKYLKEFLDFLIKNKKIEINEKEPIPKVDDKTINDKCIQIQNGKENLENWYQCMKYLLAILKYLICQVLINENEIYQETFNKNNIIKNNISSGK